MSLAGRTCDEESGRPLDLCIVMVKTARPAAKMLFGASFYESTPPYLSDPDDMAGPWCRFDEEKHEPASDIDTVAMDSLKALDPKRPIREADIEQVAFNESDL